MQPTANPIAYSAHDRTGEPVLINPRRLAEKLASTLMPLDAPYIPGKTSIRDAVMDEVDCSAAIAEGLVDSMEAHGFCRYVSSRHGVDARPGYWVFESDPRSPSGARRRARNRT